MRRKWMFSLTLRRLFVGDGCGCQPATFHDYSSFAVHRRELFKWGLGYSGPFESYEGPSEANLAADFVDNGQP
jgi:hypothetical protein